MIFSEGHIVTRMNFLYACARIKEYFYPLGFEAFLDSPSSMTARLFDTETGENVAVVAGLRWSPTTSTGDIVFIIEALEDEMRLQEREHPASERRSGPGGQREKR